MADEKTTFEIALRDAISPGLRSITTQLRALNRTVGDSARPGAESVTRLNRGATAFGGTARQVTRELAGLGSFFVGFGRGLLGVGGTIESVRAIATNLNNMATARVQLAMFTKDTRLATDDIERLRTAMRQMGMTVQNADTLIGGLTTKIQDLKALKEGSSLYQSLAKMGDKGELLARQLIKEEDYMKGIKDITEFFKKQGPDAQFWISQALGVPASVLQNLDAQLAKVKDTPNIDPKVAQQFLDNSIALQNRLDTEWTLFANHAMSRINTFFDQLDEMTGEEHALSKLGIDFFDAFEKTIQQDIKDAQGLIALYQKLKHDLEPGEAKESLAAPFDKFFGRETNRWDDAFKKLEQQQKLKDEDNKFLQDIRDALKRMEDKVSGAAGAVGGALSGAASAVGNALIPSAAASTLPGGASGLPPSSAPGTGASTGAVPHGGSDNPQPDGASADPSPGGVTTGGSGGVSRPYERRRGERGEFNYAATGALGAPGQNLTTITLKDGQTAVVNKAGAEKYRGFLNEMIDKGYPVDLSKSSGAGGYSNRSKIGGGGLSMHAYGAAMDINVRKNPWQSRTTDMPTDVEQTAWKHGLSWGGRFGDPMHFEIMSPEAAAHKQQLLEQQGVIQTARDNIDKKQGEDTWGKGTASIKFNFNNVPNGVKTNAEADGAFTKVEVERKSAMEDRAAD